MNTSADRFTRADYEEILIVARDNGYTFGRFTESQPEGNVLYVRHDIDNSLASAVELAHVEARHDCVSTYLALVRSPNYNVFAGENVRRLRAIRALGHEVGLHFTAEEHDPAAIDSDLAACIRDDASLLEHALGEPIRVFSFHNPAGKDQFMVDVPGLVNTYADPFFQDACYLSESNMRWAHGSPIETLASGAHRVVQLLVHPLTYQADFRTDRDVLLWFLEDTVRTLVELNVAQNRVLSESGLSLADVAQFLHEASLGE